MSLGGVRELIKGPRESEGSFEEAPRESRIDFGDLLQLLLVVLAPSVFAHFRFKGARDSFCRVSEVRDQVLAVFGPLAFGVVHLENCASESLVDVVREGVSLEHVIAQPDVLWYFIGTEGLPRWPYNSESPRNQRNRQQPKNNPQAHSH